MLKFGDGLVERIRNILSGNSMISYRCDEMISVTDGGCGTLNIVSDVPHKTDAQIIQIKIIMRSVYEISGVNIDPDFITLVLSIISNYTRDYSRCKLKEDEERAEVRRKLSDALL